MPDCVLQEEVQNKAQQEKFIGTFCAAELVGDSDCPSLILVLVYDTKPVHFLTKATKEICREEKTMEVFDKENGCMAKMKLLRLKVNDDYNYGMGGGRYCRPDTWVLPF